MDKKVLINIFKEYVSKFDMNDNAIKLKYNHSLRVMDISICIAKSLNLSDEEVFLAGIIGLLHDYARFTQWTNYNTYDDLKSIDHGDLGVLLLFDNNEIDIFNIEKKNYNIIYNAIKYHNKLSINKNINEKEKLFSLIIRDADKIDILDIISKRNHKYDKNIRINEKLSKQFFLKKLLNRHNIKNSKESLLLHLSMIYDLNYHYSYIYINNKKYLDNIYNNINDKESFKKYIDYLKNYINERIDCYVR